MLDEKLTPGLLVALPNLKDPYFQKTVILLCDYNEQSAFGVVINRPSNVRIKDIFEECQELPKALDRPILVGGPVQPEVLWAIHSGDFEGETTTRVNPAISMSSVQELISALGKGTGPALTHMGCGYAGWGPGQLDRELREGAWWLAPMDTDLVMKTPYDHRWQTVLRSIGLDPARTSFYETGEA